MVNAFEERHAYREAEVNAILGDFHQDVATLRREIVEMGCSSAIAANTPVLSMRKPRKHREAPRRVGGLPVVAGWSLFLELPRRRLEPFKGLVFDLPPLHPQRLGLEMNTDLNADRLIPAICGGVDSKLVHGLRRLVYCVVSLGVTVVL